MIKTEKLSRTVLNVCIAIILVVFAFFFLYGYDNPMGDYNEPKCTEAVIYLMYVLIGVTAVLAVWSAIKSIKDGMGASGENLSGVPGGKISFISVVLLVGSLAVGLLTNLNEPDFTAADGNVTSGAMVSVVDMFIISIYILMAVAAIAVVVNMSGIVEKSAQKK